MASLAFRIAASMDMNSRTGTGSGADILVSETLAGPILGRRCHSGGTGACGQSWLRPVKMKEDWNEDQVSFLGSMGKWVSWDWERHSWP